MKERILTNWTVIRGFYLVVGLYIVTQSALNREWLGVAFGGYFAAMGLFAFGCASGTCMGGRSTANSPLRSEATTQDITFEEVKANEQTEAL
jgi:hypothetical protein